MIFTQLIMKNFPFPLYEVLSNRKIKVYLFLFISNYKYYDKDLSLKSGNIINLNIYLYNLFSDKWKRICLTY